MPEGRSPDPANIYAPPDEHRPLAPEVRARGTGVWRERGMAVIDRSGGVFPERCVVCNGPGDVRLHKTLRWHPEWIYAFTVLGLVPYLILAVVLSKTAPLEYSLCSFHAGRRRTGLLAALLGSPPSVALFVLTFVWDIEALIYLGMGGLVTCLLLGLLWARVLHVGKMDDRFVSVAAGRPFVDSLPSPDSWYAPPGAGGFPGDPGGLPRRSPDYL